ncbi:glycoside hydrolase family 3 N-terminal domain-containing protein [Nitratireductor sp. ZSWI3]|uniref:glycoside hydrolase family 3 N-terminal domain-containing protein n=1 Tax=Nitratireductor sp. ZSWI3 TaxID=2966359 RepID=UPI0021504596|nr:glycoside hydrolase family 3 N-terminal domain-containing protein [Nitratireductor sp. ZSWI3]MCR4265811.1 glycoside hydrolase family 3 protein [Nitratireductor sp. ZSWI3]
MSEQRRQSERVADFTKLHAQLTGLAGGDILIAVDHELGGTNRLHSLVPEFPDKEELRSSSPEQIERVSFQMAIAAKNLGVNCLLSPTLDIVTGPTPWLDGRTWSSNKDLVGALSAAYIRGVQAAGVVAVAKHFPGHHQIARDPAIHEDARITDARSMFEAGFEPFRKAISAGVGMVMVGPAFLDAFDEQRPACVSPAVYDMLREDFGFDGVTVSDDLDSATLLKTRSIGRCAVDALNAGGQLLIIHGDELLEHLASTITEAVMSGELAREKLAAAADAVRALSLQYGAYHQ